MSTTTTTGQVAPPRIALMSPSANITWADGVTAFNGFALVVLAIPSAPTGSQYTEIDYGNLYPGLTLPLTQRIPIIQGLYNTACGLYVNNDLVPPGSSYQAYAYDSTNHQVAGPTANFVVTSTNPIDPFAAGGGLTLTGPSTLQTFTIPDTFPSNTSGGGGGGGGSPITSLTPYTQALVAVISVTIPQTMHLKGLFPFVYALDNASPSNYVINAFTVDTNGDVTATFAPAFTGTIVIY